MSKHHKSVGSYQMVALLMILAMLLTPLSAIASTQSVASGVWGSGTLTDADLWNLIGQMSVAEEDTFIHGSSDNACSGVYVSPWVTGCMGQAGWIPGIPSLGIPPLRLDDGPAGSRLGHVATAMPAPIGLTASFDRSMAYLFGNKVGIEQRALNQDVWLAPMMNTVNIPTAGRNFETTGEDPFLSGEMAVPLVTGSQDAGLMATIKHYVDNDFENGRTSTNVFIDERTQYEIELAAFEKTIKAGAAAIMCSYNRVDDIYACGNDNLLNGIARDQFGFKGFVMSDWGATHTPQDLIHGLDMEQSGSGNLGAPVIRAISLITTLDAGSTTLAAASATLLGPTNVGDTVISVDRNSGFSVGQTIGIDSGTNAESATINSIATIGLPVPSYSATPVANWIWNTAGASGGAPAGTIYVRKTFTVADASAVTAAALRINVDDQHDTYVNGALVASSHVANGWRTSQLVNIQPLLVTGTNVIAVAATNNAGDAGSMISAVQIDTSGGSTRVVSDGTWKALAGADIAPPAGWSTAAFDDSAWPAAFISGAYPLAPWNVLTDPTSTATYNFTLAAPLTQVHAAGTIVGEVTPAGVSNLKVASVSAFAVGSAITIDSGANAETATISNVGTAGASGTGLTLTAPTTLAHTGAVAVAVLGIPAGTTNIRVASTTGFMVGHQITIDTGANAETNTVTAVGSSGSSGTGLTLATPLMFDHANGASVSTGGTVAVPATNDMPAQPAYSGVEWKAALDKAVFRILTQMNYAGLLEGTQYGTQSNGCDRSAGAECTAYVPARADLQQIQPDMFAAAQKIAEASAVLLKNNQNVLPLTCEDLTTGNGVVLMGPTAISTYTGGGGSAHVRPFDPVQSSYDALIAAAQAKCGDGVKVSYVPGYDIDGPIVPSSVLTAPDPAEGYPNWTLKPEDAAFANQPGLLRQQITTDSVPSGSQPVFYTGVGAAPDQLDATVNYAGNNGLPAGTAWRWSGTLTAPASGSYALRIFIADQASAQLFIDGLNTTQRRINQGAYPTYFPDSMTNSYATQTVAQKTHDPDLQDGQRPNYNVTLTEGQRLHLDLRVYAGDAQPVRVQFRWVPTTNQADQIAVAAAAAGAANKVVDFVWDEGSEGSDRGGNAIANGLALPGYQNDVVAAVVAANPNTVVLLNTGDSVFMPWANDVNSILEMWYPGQMGGPATANVLLGNVNPSGKLPETFFDGNAPIGQRFPQDTQPAACADNSGGSGFYGQGNGTLPGNPGNCPLYPGIYLPGFLGTNLHGYRTINYSDQELGGIQGNGIFQGYRWFDKNDYAPLFAFGHGLSYTTFEYRNLVLKAEKGGTVRVSFIVQNKGGVAGAVVPQVYVGAAPSPVEQAVRALRGFDRVELQPNEAKRVEITLDPRSFQYWDDEVLHAWTFLGGERTIWVGDSSRDLRLSGPVTPMAQ